LDGFFKEIEMQKYLIKTEHLGLRFIRKEDIQFLKDLDTDPEVKKFFPEGALSIKEIKDFINDSIDACENENLPCFVIFQLETAGFVGEAYFGELDTGEAKVGYILHQEYWNRGYATEILEALIEWARVHMDVDYIHAFADKKNKASFHVMENCGMQYYKDRYYLDMDCKFYRIKIR
jgi:ribosomal-protein-alanine N-acetyltransferase